MARTFTRSRRRLARIETLQRRELLAADSLAPAMVANVAAEDSFAPIEFTVDQLDGSHQLDLLGALPFPYVYEGPRRITWVGPTETVDSAVTLNPDGLSVRYDIGALPGNDSFAFIIDDAYLGTASVKVLEPVVPDHYQVIAQGHDLVMRLLANDFQPHQGDHLWGVASAEQGTQYKSQARITALLDADPGEFEISADGQTVLFKTPSTATGLREFRYLVNDQFVQAASVLVSDGMNDDHYHVDSKSDPATLRPMANDRYRDRFSGLLMPTADQITAVTQGEHGGTVQIAADGKSVRYIPQQDFIGTDSFQYTSDGVFHATVTVDVRQFAADDEVELYLDSSRLIDVLNNDFRQPGVRLNQITAVFESQIGAAISIENNQIRYVVPEAASLDQLDQFTYTADGQYQGTVHVQLGSPAVADHVHVDRPRQILLDVLTNDHLGDGYRGAGQITQVTQPGAGSVAIHDNGAQLLYTPGSNSETFTYTVDDRFTASVMVSQAEHLSDDTVHVTQNEPEWFIDVLANDFESATAGVENPYDGPKQVFVEQGSEQGAVIEVTSDNRIRYVPPVDFYGLDTFSYRVDEFLTATVAVHVNRSLRDDVFYIDVNSGNNQLQVLANDLFGDGYQGQRLITAVDEDSSSVVEVSDDGRSLIYSPPNGLAGQHQFRYTVDGQFTASVEVNIGGVPDGPANRFDSIETLQQDYVDAAIARRRHQFEREYLAAAGVTRASCIINNIDLMEPAFDPYQQIVSPEGPVAAGASVMVHSDGEFIYSLRSGSLTITRRLADGGLNVVSQSPVTGRPRGMFLDGDRLTLVSETEFGPVLFQNCGGDDTVVPANAIVSVYDLADRSRPALVQQTMLEGSFVEAKTMAGAVVVTVDGDWEFPNVEVACDQDVCRTESAQEFQDRLESDFARFVQPLLPTYQAFDQNGSLLRSGAILNAPDLMHFGKDLVYADRIKLIATFDPHSNEPGISSAAGVLGDHQTRVYLGDDHVYLFQTNDIETPELAETQIQKFALTGAANALSHVASGIVPGYIENLMEVDEHDGLLRIATVNRVSIPGASSDEFSTTLSVLEEHSGVLKTVGFLHGLGVNQFRRVQFAGDVAFAVPKDHHLPLTAIDLSDSTNPSRVAEIEFKGVLADLVSIGSINHVQMVSPDRWITISGNKSIAREKAKLLALWDVSDLSNPVVLDYQLADQEVVRGSGEPNAPISYFDGGVLTVPFGQHDGLIDDVDVNSGQPSQIWRGSQEIALLDIDLSTDSINVAGMIEYDGFLQRTLAIGGYLYLIGLDGIHSVPTDQLAAMPQFAEFGEMPGLVAVPRESIELDPVVNEAREWLGNQLGVSSSHIWLEATESRRQGTELLFRVAGNLYRVSASDQAAGHFVHSRFQVAPNRHHNRMQPTDANGDHDVTPADALVIMNHLASERSVDITDAAIGQIFPRTSLFADVNGDGQITPRDALMVINELARSQVDQQASAEWINLPADPADEDEDFNLTPATLF